MRMTRLALAAVALFSTFAVPGCGEGTAPPPSQEALTKPADTSQFGGMMDQMKSNVDKNKRH